MYKGYYDYNCCCKKSHKKCCKKSCKKCCKKECCYDNYGEENNSGFGNIYSLIILILIVLQFGTKCHDDGGSKCKVDNSILFIIALFLLIYCNGCKDIFNFGLNKGYGC